MGYEKVFEKPYPGGWKDLPDRTTPVTAAIMDGYDEAIEHIETHLNGSSAVFPIQATGGMTQPVGIDENGRLVTMPSSSGGGTASEITYDNTESGLESTDVQGAIDELAAGAGEKVTPVPKTEDMTQEVGIDENGELWTVPGGGGSGNTTKIDTLFEDTTYEGVTSGTINLSRPVTNYDFIKFTVVMTSSGHDLRNSVSYDIDTITDYIIDSNKIMTLVGYGEYINLRFSDAQTITVDSVQNLGVVKIVGIKYGSGRGTSSGLVKLWEYANSPAGMTSGTMELSDDYTNYDFLIFSSVRNNTSLQGNGIISTEDLNISKTLTSKIITIPGAAGAYGAITVTDSTHLFIDSCSSEYGFRAIYGYKAGSGSAWTKLLDVRDESSQTADSYTLSESILNYKTILIQKYYMYQSKYIIGSTVIDVDHIILGDSTAWYQLGDDGSRDLTVTFDSQGTQITKQSGSSYIFAVYGK